MLNVKKSDFLELSELTQQVAVHSLSFDIRLSNLPDQRSSKKHLIEVIRDEQNKIQMDVVPHARLKTASPLHQIIEFEDDECEAMSYFLEKWDYAVCHLYTVRKKSVIEVHYAPCLN